MIDIYVQEKSIPSQLRDKPQWVGWQAERKDDGGLNKIPKNAQTGLAAKTNDPTSWSTFEQALDYHQKRQKETGIGFVFGQHDPFLGIDLDGCRDIQTGEVQSWAQQIVDQCASYTEVSPSATGVKIFLQGQMPGSKHKASYHSGAVEIYDQKRFFTVTGHHLKQTPAEVVPNQAAIDQIYNRVFATAEEVPQLVEQRPVIAVEVGDDQALIGQALAAENGEKFRALWQGRWEEAGYHSASEADLALASLLAFWTRCDQDRIRKLMQQSALKRDKYQRADYLDRTIKRACQAGRPVDNIAVQTQPLTQVMGLVQGEKYYYRQLKQGPETIDKQISSFLLRATQRVLLEGRENLSADLITCDGGLHPITFPRTAWNSKEGFMNQLTSLDLQWYGTAHDVQCLQALVASHDVPQKQGTVKLGYHDGCWVWPQLVQDQQGVIEDPWLVYLPTGGQGELDDKLQPLQLPSTQSESVIKTLFDEVWLLNRVEVMVPVLGWFMATPFKPQLRRYWEGFPHLSVAGTRGAGKSTLLRLMWRLMGFKAGEASRLFSCTETDFVMLKLLSTTSSIPLVFDEYKPYDMPPHRLKSLSRTLRKAYDGEKAFRGRPDQTTNEYALTAPVAIAGEVSLSEGALLERIIAVQMSPNHLNHRMRKAYATLQTLPLNAFISAYVPFVLATEVEAQIKETELMALDLIDGDDLPDRVHNNLKVMLFGFNQFLRFGQLAGLLDDDQSYHAMLKPALTAVKESVCGSQGVTRLALDDLLDNLAVMAEVGRLQAGTHYQLLEPAQVAIRLKSCLAEFRRFHRETQLQGELLDMAAYHKQLRENQERQGYVLETSKAVTFTSGHNQRKRAVIIDLEQALALGLDLSGFEN